MTSFWEEHKVLDEWNGHAGYNMTDIWTKNVDIQTFSNALLQDKNSIKIANDMTFINKKHIVNALNPWTGPWT